MSKVITFSRYFPSYHPRKGEPTYFVEKIIESFDVQFTHDWVHWEFHHPFLSEMSLDTETKFNPKYHTIRAGHRFKEGDWFSPRIWGNDVNPKSGRSGPRHSKQIIIAPDIQVKRTWNFDIEPLAGDYILQGYPVDINKLKIISLNDGLDIDDFECWFKLKRGEGFCGQIICWNGNIKY